MKIEFEFPYDPKLSKNEWHVFTGVSKNPYEGLPGVPVTKRRSAVVNATSATKLMGDVERLARGKCILLKRLYGLEFKPCKIWLMIMVYKPDMNLDAINVLGMIADGIKRGIRVDDNVFSAVVDWKIDTDDPRIMITVMQGSREDVLAYLMEGE